MEIETLIADISRAEKRANDVKYLEAREEFAKNAYPLLAEIVSFFGEKISELEDVVAELIDVEDNQIQPDLAAKISAVLALGLQLAEVASQVIPHIPDPTAKAATATIVNNFRALSAEVLAEVQAATLELESEEEEDADVEDPGNDGDLEDDEDADTDEEEEEEEVENDDE